MTAVMLHYILVIDARSLFHDLGLSYHRRHEALIGEISRPGERTEGKVCMLTEYVPKISRTRARGSEVSYARRGGLLMYNSSSGLLSVVAVAFGFTPSGILPGRQSASGTLCSASLISAVRMSSLGLNIYAKYASPLR